MFRGKLTYFYGCMNAAKSANLLLTAHQHEEYGNCVILLKPSIDTRDVGVIKSRALPNGRECVSFDKDDDLEELIWQQIDQCGLVGINKSFSIFIDECHFMTREQVKQLWNVTRSTSRINIYCFGLKMTYKNTIFDAFAESMIYADNHEEIKSKCSFCNEDAKTHVKYIGDKPNFTDGDDVCIGDVKGEESYKSLCMSCRELIERRHKQRSPHTHYINKSIH